MAALSMATDLGIGQPLESALCSYLVAMRLGDALGLNDDARRDVRHRALLRYIGCDADTYARAALFGDGNGALPATAPTTARAPDGGTRSTKPDGSRPTEWNHPTSLSADRGKSRTAISSVS